jgi:nucleotide sugar dehydrogenase
MNPSAPTAIVGLGYVGLPLAQAAVRAGVSIIGFDINQRTIDQLTAGTSPISDIDDSGIQEMLSLGFSPTSDSSALDRCDTYVICVPTPLSDEQGPDLTAVVSATRSLIPHIKAGDLVILESTTYPGTTEEVVAPILAESGLSIPEQVKLAFSPERVDPGNPTYGITNTPKVVGGLNPESGEAAEAFYSQFCDTVVLARGAKEAELAKLLENTYRHVNIALVNELAVLSHELEIDLWDSIRCAATKPFGFQAFYPGPGVGGHCIPIDPNYLSHHVRSRLGQTFRFVELAQDINSAMPGYVCRRLQDLLNDSGLALRGSRIAVLGVTYKPNVADSRESPSEPIAKNLIRMGANLSFWDPFVPEWSVDGTAIPRIEQLSSVVDPDKFDAILLLQQHQQLDLNLISKSQVPVFDTRNVLDVAGSVERL